MTKLDKITQSQTSGLAKVWQRTPVFIKAIVLGLLVNTIGILNIPIFTTYLPPALALIGREASLGRSLNFRAGTRMASKADQM